MIKKLRIIISLLFISLSTTVFSAPAPLPALNALPDETSISGLSSGAFMAAQFHVAFSDKLVGAGIVAGGPWNCAGNNPYSNPFLTPIMSATTTCMNPCKGSLFGCPSMLYPNSDFLADLAQETEKTGKIDPLDNLKDDRIYIFSGASDKTVVTGVVDTTADFYRQLGVTNDRIRYNKKTDAGHAFITTDPNDTPCSKTTEPFINDCDIYQAQRILEHIYGTQNPAAKTLSGELIEFDQSAFFDSPLTSMNDTAYVYVPKNCRTEQCKVHVSVHGCEQGASEIGTTYVKDTGYLEIADTNSTIVLFPQVKKSKLTPFNPKGCWDFWGYSNNDLPPYNYYNKNAPQMIAINKMIARLTSNTSKMANN